MCYFFVVKTNLLCNLLKIKKDDELIINIPFQFMNYISMISLEIYVIWARRKVKFLVWQALCYAVIPWYMEEMWVLQTDQQTWQTSSFALLQVNKRVIHLFWFTTNDSTPPPDFQQKSDGVVFFYLWLLREDLTPCGPYLNPSGLLNFIFHIT